jgi:ABC-type multidrug transport system ATPase subunit
MSAVRSLSLRGRLVVCTLHQPSPDIFALFDRLTALANGQLLYHGKTQGKQTTDVKSANIDVSR